VQQRLLTSQHVFIRIMDMLTPILSLSLSPSLPLSLSPSLPLSLSLSQGSSPASELDPTTWRAHTHTRIRTWLRPACRFESRRASSSSSTSYCSLQCADKSGNRSHSTVKGNKRKLRIQEITKGASTPTIHPPPPARAHTHIRPHTDGADALLT